MKTRRLFTNLSVGCGLLVLLATGLSLLENEVWWIRIFDFPRLQILVLALISLALYFFCRRPRQPLHFLFLGSVSASLFYQAFRIFPYTPLAPITAKASTAPADSANHISLVVTNVLMDNRQAGPCLQMIREANPDIVLALETDKWWEEQLAALHPDYPYQLHHPLPNTYGLLFYSRLPLHQPHLRFLVQPDVPSVKAKVELRSGHQVGFFGLHPRPPAPQESGSSLPRDAELILVGKEIGQAAVPTIVAGDLNDVAWSHTSKLFLEVSQLLDPRKGRGFFNTFNAHYPIFRWPLDHVFHSEHFRVLELRRLPPIGSDHFPIYIKLSYEPEKQHQQPTPKPEPEDIRDAEEKLEKAEEKL